VVVIPSAADAVPEFLFKFRRLIGGDEEVTKDDSEDGGGPLSMALLGTGGDDVTTDFMAMPEAGTNEVSGSLTIPRRQTDGDDEAAIVEAEVTGTSSTVSVIIFDAASEEVVTGNIPVTAVDTI
jgi:hypothetical protein